MPAESVDDTRTIERHSLESKRQLYPSCRHYRTRLLRAGSLLFLRALDFV